MIESYLHIRAITLPVESMTVEKEKITDIASRCASVRTLMTARSITRLYDQALKNAGITGTQFSLLVAIGSHNFNSISELGDALNIEKSTLSRNLKPLIDAGLIEREKANVSRAITHRLTAAGQAKLVAAYPLWQAAQSRVEEELSQDDLQAGYRFMARLRHAADS